MGCYSQHCWGRHICTHVVVDTVEWEGMAQVWEDMRAGVDTVGEDTKAGVDTVAWEDATAGMDIIGRWKIRLVTGWIGRVLPPSWGSEACGSN